VYAHAFIGFVYGTRVYTSTITAPGIYIAVLEPQSIMDDLTVCVRQNGASTDATNTITIEWIALYEGAYTIDTLPPYVPKEKNAELDACHEQLYYFD